MKITIDLQNIQKTQDNIDALKRYADHKQNSGDFVLLLDTISVLENIKKIYEEKCLPRCAYIQGYGYSERKCSLHQGHEGKHNMVLWNF